MTAACRSFRRELERVLERAQPLVELSWSEHLLGCEACRALLEEEEALEALLGSLPEPALPADLAERVLARLRANRTAGDPLDSVLETVGAPQVPGALAANLLDALQLDRALELLPEPEVPPGLAQRTLLGLRRHRRSRRPQLWLAAAAAVLLLGWAGASLFNRDEVQRRPSELVAERRVEPGVAPEDEALLEYLDVLEDWELLVSEDLDVMLSSLDPVDEMLLDWTESSDGPEEG